MKSSTIKPLSVIAFLFLISSVSYSQSQLPGTWEGMYAREVKTGKWENMYRWELQLNHIDDSTLSGTLKEFYPDDRLKAERNRIYNKLSAAGAQSLTLSLNKNTGVLYFKGSAPFRKDLTQRVSGLYYAGVNGSLFDLKFQFQSSDESLSYPTLISLVKIKEAAGRTASVMPGTAEQAVTPAPGIAGGWGEIAPGAVELEVDFIKPFFGSFAIVGKGVSTALINDKGAFFVPFNKYEFTESYNRTIYNPVFGINAPGYAGAVEDKLIYIKVPNVKKFGYINPKGKTVFLEQEVRMLDMNGYFYEDEFDKRGQFPVRHYLSIPFKPIGHQGRYNGTLIGNLSPRIWANNLTVVTEIAAPGKSNEVKERPRTNFADRLGNLLVPQHSFDDADNFSEGVAWVAKKNEYGELRWGLLDTTGRMLIPFTYTHQPSTFSNGRSLIKPVDKKSDIEFACIDKKGAVIFTLPFFRNDTASVAYVGAGQSGTDFPTKQMRDYQEGYRFVSVSLKPNKQGGGLYLLDTNGVYHPTVDRIANQVIQQGFPISSKKNIKILSFIKNGEFVFEAATFSWRGVGLANVRGEVLIPPVFQAMDLFEPESSIQRAFYLDKKKNIRREGYINREGKFVVLLKPKSGF